RRVVHRLVHRREPRKGAAKGSFPHAFPQLWRDSGGSVSPCKNASFAVFWQVGMLAAPHSRVEGLANRGGAPNRADCGEPVERSCRSAQRCTERHDLRNLVRGGTGPRALG